MARTRAVLFDLGGTLYDYANLEPGNREALVALVRAAGRETSTKEIFGAYRDSLREVFNTYLPKPFYLHRDLFHDALVGLTDRLVIPLTDELLNRYREIQRLNLERDFTLREGVHDTLAAMRGAGLYTGIVSNIDEEQLTNLVELGRLRELFDDLLSSEAARSCKPHRAIFEEALRRAECAADEALFVGDTVRQDIEGANRAGMRSVLLWHREDRGPPEAGARPSHVIRRIGDLMELLD
jgi:HAD superfamily hydrolase (TIGR01549 family)